jgi:orotate phosphoribosyltransferase
VTREELARRLAERALLRGEFVLRSGKTSSVYLDKYRFETDPALLGPLAEALAAEAARVEPDAALLAGPELGAVPLVTALSLRDGRPFLIVRGKPKDYGTANRLEGVWEPGQRVLLVEDIVTSGGAALEAVFALRESGLVVETALCVLDREEGGRQSLAAVGIALHPLLQRADLGLDPA